MAKLKIYTFPDLILTQKALPVPRVEKSYFKLADDMLETMYSAPGIGLAANQVGILERFLVLDTEYEHDDLDELEEGVEVPPEAEVYGTNIVMKKKPRIIINPELIYKEGKQKMSEGCLSVPEYTAEVERFNKIKVQYKTIDGLTKTIDAEGLLAVALQHEMDHLEGKLFIDRLSPLKKDLTRKRLKKEREERDQFESLEKHSKTKEK